MDIKASQFVNVDGRRVLTDDGQPGMDGRADIGSTTELHLGAIASAIFANAARLDDRQLGAIVEWISLYRRKPLDDDHFMKVRSTDFTQP